MGEVELWDRCWRECRLQSGEWGHCCLEPPCSPCSLVALFCVENLKSDLKILLTVSKKAEVNSVV